MVSFHDSALPVVTETAERWHSNVATLGNRGTGFLLYSLLDSLVDGYFPVIDDIAERAETLEESIILQGQPTLQAEILRLRRELLMIRRVAGTRTRRDEYPGPAGSATLSGERRSSTSKMSTITCCGSQIQSISIATCCRACLTRISRWSRTH